MKKRLADFYDSEIFKTLDAITEEMEPWMACGSERTEGTNQRLAVNLHTGEIKSFPDDEICRAYEFECYKLEDIEEEEYEDEIELPFGEEFKGKQRKEIEVNSLDDIPEEVRDEFIDALRDLLDEDDEDEIDKLEGTYVGLIGAVVRSGHEVDATLGYADDGRLMINARIRKGE